MRHLDAPTVWGLCARSLREDWLRWSRARAARSVAARSGKRVEAHHVREWERGQPPASLEELDAYLALLRSLGLTAPEVGDVEAAIHAALVQRYYGTAGRFDALSLADVTSEAALCASAPILARALPLPEHIAITRAVTEALDGRFGPLHPTTEADLRLHLAVLRTEMLTRHQWAGRLDRILVECDAMGPSMDPYGGRGAFGFVSRTGAAAQAAYARALQAPSETTALGLWEVCLSGLRSGADLPAGGAWCWLLQHITLLPEAVQRAVWALEPEMVDRIAVADPVGEFVQPVWHIVDARIRCGLPDAAAEGLGAVGHVPPEAQAFRGALWWLHSGQLEAGWGSRDSAARLFGRALAIAEEAAYVILARAARDGLETASE